MYGLETMLRIEQVSRYGIVDVGRQSLLFAHKYAYRLGIAPDVARKDWPRLNY